jgi:hypothetical protein
VGDAASAAGLEATVAAPGDGGRTPAHHDLPTPSRAPQLQIYVSETCASCRRAWELVTELRRLRPGAAVALVDIDRLEPDARPTDLVGTPTYVLRGRVRWLGNPSAEELLAGWDEETDPASEEAGHGRWRTTRPDGSRS